ncbi:hypothetical protein [Pseudodesulfovibrio karagichevae]|uniref:Transcriptional regulator, AlpA family n=1 Tax=Pseudodesulfovibrio karagichevae TaxID=3239305 RepID=A0ABV4K465_9BACT
MEKLKKQMKIIGRAEAARRLGMTPQALSCHVSRRAWPHAIPAPIKIGGIFKWSDEKITEWINERFDEVEGGKSQKEKKRKRRPGRPPKTRSASCS